MKNFALFTLILTQVAFAEINYKFGEWGSGGGNAVVCFPKGQIAIGDQAYNIIDEIRKNNNQIADKFLPFIESIEMYDLFEAKKRRGVSGAKPEILNIEEKESIYEYIDRISSRFQLYVPVLTNLIPVAKKLIPDSKFIHHGYAVKYQNDMGEVTLPAENCIVSTVAGQVNINGRENGFYEVHLDSRLYNHGKFSKQSKATLILHEFIYALTRKYFDHTNSASTRNIVRFYISYSTDFTEGFIAKSLSELGFHKSDEPRSQLWKDHHYSAIMTDIGLHLEVLHDQLKDYIGIELYTDHDGDGEVDPTQYPEEVQLRINSMIETEKIYLKQSLNERAVVDEKLMEQLMIKFDFYTHIFNVNNGIESYNEEINISSDEAFHNIYYEFLETKSCSTSVNMPIPETSADAERSTRNEQDLFEDCAGPITLTNIIPKA